MDVDLMQRAQASIAQGALTNSKRPESFVKGVYPTHVKMGQGAYLWDSKNKKYIDFICGLGANLLGYGVQSIYYKAGKQMMYGPSLSFSTPDEVECAEKVKELFPFIDCMKFLKTGTEACLAALKIARAATGRTLVLSEGYHGWGDEFVSLTPPAAGVPQNQTIKPLKHIMDITTEVAAVIVEPVITEFTPERVDYLKNLREWTRAMGAVLIFDEIITGFRFPKFSVAAYTGVKPDLILLGKAIANGLPLSVVGGSYALMNGSNYFVSSTFAGETCSLVAATETMTLLQTKHNVEKLWEAGQAWIDRFNQIWPEGIRLKAYPTRGVFEADPLTKALFMQETCRAGLLFGPSWFFNFAHAALDLDYFSTIEEIICRIKKGQVTLMGEMPRSPFAAKVRGNG